MATSSSVIVGTLHDASKRISGTPSTMRTERRASPSGGSVKRKANPSSSSRLMGKSTRSGAEFVSSCAKARAAGRVGRRDFCFTGFVFAHPCVL